MATFYNPRIVGEGLVHLLDPAAQSGAGVTTQTICGTVSENQTLNLTAPPGYEFTSVDFASYGTPTGTCGNFAIGPCHATTSQSVVEGYLLGNRETVSIPATNAVFGDPCGGTFKRLYVQATVSGIENQSFTNSVKGSNSIWNTVGMSLGNTAGARTFRSNVIADGSGNAYITVSSDGNLETGSITCMLWFNVDGIPVNVGSNNNWRGLWCTLGSGTAGYPITMVMEQSGVINFSTGHTDGYRRYLNNSFAPISYNSTGWQMVTYTYDAATGQAACYKNADLVRSGPMTTNSSNGSPTTAGLNLSYTRYSSNNSGFRIYGGTTTNSNPGGNGMCPGELGSVMVYNRALGADEVKQNFNALRKRYNL